MTEQEEKEKYLRGYNYGYLLAEHEPELLKKILSQASHDQLYNNASPFIRGLNFGQSLYYERKTKEQKNEKPTSAGKEKEIEKLKIKAKNKDKDRER